MMDVTKIKNIEQTDQIHIQKSGKIRRLVTFVFVLSFLTTVLGIIELSRGPYFGFASNASIDSSSIEENSPLAKVLPNGKTEQPSLENLRQIENLALDQDLLIEDPDYLGDTHSINRFFAFQTQLQKTLASKPDKTLKLLFSANNDSFDVSVAPITMGIKRAISRSWMMLMLGFFSIAAGYILAMRRPRDADALRFFAMTVSVELIFSTFGIYTARDILFSPATFRVFFILNTLAFASFFFLFSWFFFNFPAPKAFLASKKTRIILYSAGIIAVGLAVSRVFGSLSNIFFLGGLVLGLASLAHSYFKAKNLVQRYQVRWIFWGTLAFVLVFCITAILPSIIFGKRLVSDKIPSLFFPLIPLTILVSIEKHHLMDIDKIVDRSLVYLISIIFISILDVIVVIAIQNMTKLDTSSSVLVASLTVCLIFALIYLPLKERLAVLIGMLLGNKNTDAVTILLDLSTALYGVQSPLEAAQTFKNYLVKQFGSQSAELELHIQGQELCQVLTLPADFKSSLPVKPLYLHEFNIAHLRPEYIDSLYLPFGENIFVQQADSQPPQFSGFILLHRRIANTMYARSDIALLEALAADFSRFVEGLLGRERVIQAETNLLREKERLARDIHDGLGGVLTTSLMLLDASPRPDSVRELRNNLQAGLGELRALVWTMNDEESDLEALVLVIRDRLVPPLKALGCSCTIEFSGNTPLKSSVRMNLYRIAQEFITNCAKYSLPGKLLIKFTVTATELKCLFASQLESSQTQLLPSPDFSGKSGEAHIAKRAADLAASVHWEKSDTGRQLLLKIPLEKKLIFEEKNH